MKRRRVKSAAPAQAPTQLVRVTAGYDAVKWSPNRAYIQHNVQDAALDLTPYVLEVLRKNSRYLYCNSAIYAGVVERLVTLIVGTGILASSASATPEWAKRATGNFGEWAKRCDIARISTMPTIQQSIARAVIVDGEAFLLLTSDEEDGNRPRVQLLEAHKIESVETNDFGRPTFYIPTGAKKAKTKDGRSPDAIPADQIVHFYRPSRPGQLRGVPLFSAAMNTARDVDELINIEKAASKAAATTVEVINTASGEAPNVPMIARSQRSQSAATGVPDSYYREMIGPEARIFKNGETYQQITSQRPGQNWQGFVEFLVQLLCLAGNLPPSVYLQLKVGGADTRRDLASAQRVVEQWQQLLSDGLQRVWEFATENDPDSSKGAPDDWRRVSWQYPRKVTVDDGRTSASDRSDVASGGMTIEEFCGQYGAAGSEHIRQLKAEMREVNPSLTDEQVDALLVKRLFGVDSPSTSSAKAQDAGAGGGADVSTQKDAAAAGDVQAAALNGAQVQSLVEIALKVASGDLPRESAAAIAGAAFPLIPAAVIARIFDGIIAKPQQPPPAA